MAPEKSAHYGLLQEFVDALFAHDEELPRIDIVVMAESYDLNEDLTEIISLLPPGRYTRIKLCSQINSSLSSHGWGYYYGTVA